MRGIHHLWHIPQSAGAEITLTVDDIVCSSQNVMQCTEAQMTMSGYYCCLSGNWSSHLENKTEKITYSYIHDAFDSLTVNTCHNKAINTMFFSSDENHIFILTTWVGSYSSQLRGKKESCLMNPEEHLDVTSQPLKVLMLWSNLTQHCSWSADEVLSGDERDIWRELYLCQESLDWITPSSYNSQF